MPTNLYGLGDKFDLESSHVLPALIRKMHEAKTGGCNEVVVWGTGTPRREFLFSDDLADACVHLLNLPEEQIERIFSAQYPPLINIGTGSDISIKELAQIVKRVVGFTGELAFDTTKPDGTQRKLLDISQLKQMGWRHRVELEEGIAEAYQAFLTSIR